jgi:hypothetical protein
MDAKKLGKSILSVRICGFCRKSGIVFRVCVYLRLNSTIKMRGCVWRKIALEIRRNFLFCVILAPVASGAAAFYSRPRLGFESGSFPGNTDEREVGRESKA